MWKRTEVFRGPMLKLSLQEGLIFVHQKKGGTMKDIKYPEEIKREHWKYLLRKMEREKKGGEGDS